MNIDQVQWALPHDWFLSAIANKTNDRYLVVCRDDQSDNGSVAFTSYQALRDWAGY